MLDELREALLALHGAVIALARAEWEALHGPVSPTKMVELLTQDTAFTWLRPMTKLILRIDEAIDEEARHRRGNPRAADRRMDEALAAELREGVRMLLEEEESFLERYRDLLQKDSEIAGLHASVRGFL
jgi:hypothetical protein